MTGVSSGTDDPVGHLSRAEEALVIPDAEAAAGHLRAAIAGFTAAGDCRQAALACARMGHLFSFGFGHAAAAQAWFRRAVRLVADEPPCVEQGWVAVAALGCEVDDPAVLRAQADLALDRARRFHDVNLETKALADGGLAWVQAGDIDRGMAMLEEAMALACGQADDGDTVGRSVCSFLTACYYAGDFDRAGSWAAVLGRQGLIGPGPGASVILTSHCAAVHAATLCELGRWGEAEAVLVAAKAESAAGMHASWHPDIALAELRIRQDRLAEAEALLLGKDAFLQALLPAARLHLARGDHRLARAAAQRGLRAVGDDRLRGSELLAVLVDAELAAGDVGAARRCLTELGRRSDRLAVPGLHARVGAIQARVQAAEGDPAGAVATVEAALDQLPAGGVPVLRACLQLDLVRLHEQAGDVAAATVEAARVAAALAALDIVVPAEHAARLRRLGPGPAPPATRDAVTACLEAQDRGWVAVAGGTRARLADSKGLRYLAELLRRPGVERHALDLVDRVEGLTTAGEAPDRRRLGDAGPAVDPAARRAYRHRVEALRAEIDDAVAGGAESTAEQLQVELDQVVGQLAAAFGLGGRSRPSASAAERARLNVTRALRAATARLSEALPDAGPELDRRVRTGMYCVYEPAETDAVRWIVQS